MKQTLPSAIIGSKQNSLMYINFLCRKKYHGVNLGSSLF